MYIYTYIYICVCVCIHIHMVAGLFLFILVYIYPAIYIYRATKAPGGQPFGQVLVFVGQTGEQVHISMASSGTGPQNGGRVNEELLLRQLRQELLQPLHPS